MGWIQVAFQPNYLSNLVFFQYSPNFHRNFSIKFLCFLPINLPIFYRNFTKFSPIFLPYNVLTIMLFSTADNFVKWKTRYLATLILATSSFSYPSPPGTITASFTSQHWHRKASPNQCFHSQGYGWILGIKTLNSHIDFFCGSRSF